MVEWKKLGDVCSLERGVRVVRKDLQEIGHIPVFQNSLTPLGYFEKSNYPAHTAFVICAGAAGEVGFSDVPFWAADDCTCVICNPYMVSKYTYYYLLVKQHFLKSQVRKASVPRLSKTVIEKIKIPIPSFEEQNRIVGILDTFTDSIENLKQQITQRRKQYEHYRDQLLDLEGKEGVEMKTLGEVLISLKTGLNPRKNFVLNSPNSKNYYITVRELGLFEIKPSDKTDRVTDDALKLINNRSNLEEGDILFSGTGTIGRTALVKEKPTNWNIKEGVYTLKPYKDRIDSRYLIQLLHTNSVMNRIGALVVGDPIRSIPMKSMVTVSIPVPSLSEQQRIVSILDTFEASISNLEAQLAQRQKQYEYYRNQLLTFE